MVETKDSEQAAGPQLPTSAATGVEPGAPTCPRRRWCEWRREQPGQGPEGEHQHRHMWHHFHHWHHVGPQQSGAPGEHKEWPPRDWQQWHERRWHGHCPFAGRSGRPSTATGPRVPLDDSRWMEDFFSWY